MALQERGMARPHAQALPHAVAEDEARVEHRHDRPLTRDQLAVDPDKERSLRGSSSKSCVPWAMTGDPMGRQARLLPLVRFRT